MIPDYPGFDNKCHTYIVATASGDAWEAKRPISIALWNDKQNAAHLETTDEDANQILSIPLNEWVDSLYVYEDEDEVAEFDFTAGLWK